MNKKLIQVFGIRRSGNHAVISWIFDHEPGPAVHLNEIKDIEVDPYDSCAHINVKGIPFLKCKRRLLSYLKQKRLGNRVYRFSRNDRWLSVENIKKRNPKNVIILSYEDYSITKLLGERSFENLNASIGFSDSIKKVFVLRDVHNLFASLIQSGMVGSGNIGSYIELYKEYAKVALGVGNPEPSPAHVADCPETMFANYNKWVVDKNYRCNLAMNLGFATDGRPYTRVPKEGGGSTFDGTALDGSTLRLRVFDRWKSVESDALYKRVLKDEEACFVSDEIFGKRDDWFYS